MKSFKATIHYAHPCKLGGIQSNAQSFIVYTTDEDKAYELATVHGVDDPGYLYTIMVDIEQAFLY